jgi:hypothetical protein
VWEFARGSEMMRISMLSYGVFYLLYPVAIVTFILSKKFHVKLKYKHWLYYSGIILITTLLITLTRRIQIDVIATTIILIFIISYLFRTGKLSEIFKLVIPVMVVYLVLFLIFPKYADYVGTTAEDTFLLMTTGKDSRGIGDERVSSTGGFEITEKYISENLIFGTGYTYLYWGPGYATSPRGDTFAIAADAAGEIPIYYLLFGFGVVGAILMAPLYYTMIILFFHLAKLLKLTLINYLQDPLTIIFSIYILLFITGTFTHKLYGLSSDFTGEKLSFTAFIMGLGLALYRKIYFNIYEEFQ